jgi:hypothetical protein
MLRTVLSLGVVAVLLAAVGCTMPCHPNDYCGPVYGTGGCQTCSSQARVGSVLANASNLDLSPELAAERPAPIEAASRVSPRNTAKGEPKAGYVPGSERVVSVTKRVVPTSTPRPVQ